MIIFKKITDNLSITGEVYSNSKAWGHEVKAIYHGREIEKNRIRYHNRTWERYQFESAWRGLTDKLDKTNAIPLSERLALARAIKNNFA